MTEVRVYGLYILLTTLIRAEMAQFISRESQID